MSKNNKLKFAITEILRLADNPITRTKIVKILYLADLKSFERLNKSVTDTQYIRYFYGPFSKSILDTLDSMEGQEIVETINMDGIGNRYYTYKLNPNHKDEEEIKFDVNDELNLKKREILTQTIISYVNKPTSEVLDTVYSSAQFNDTEFGREINLNA